MSRTPSPTFIYWKVASRAQLPMLLLASKNIKFDWNDTMANKWPASKSEMPFGQLPVLELENGIRIGQSGAIARYCATLAKLLPDNPVDRAVVESIMDQCDDVFDAMGKAKYAGDDVAQAKAWWAFEEGGLDSKIQSIESMLQSRSDIYFGGKEANAADIAVFSVMNLVDRAGVSWKERYPNITNLYTEIAGMGGIPGYLDKQYPVYFEKKVK